MQRTLSRPVYALVALAMCSAMLVGAFASTASAVPPSPELLARMANDPVLAAQVQAGIDAEKAAGIDQPATQPLTFHNGLLPQGVFGTVVANVQVSPPSGTTHWLALLVDFSDKPAQASASSLGDMLWKDVTGKASVRGYYREVSAGKLDLSQPTSETPGAIGWLRMPHPYAYYVGTGKGQGAYPANSQGMTEDACAAAAAAGVDFSQYDNNHDGYVDGVIIIHAGPGAEMTGNSAVDIWSHSWSIPSPYKTYNGVKVKSFTTEPEYWNTPGDMTIGVYCHELGHNFGLPDFYDTDYTSSGLGNWSLMAGGSWGGTLGNSPSRPDAWSQIKLNFATPTVVTSQITPAHIRAATQSDTGTILRIARGGAASGTEYYLVENRQKVNTDTGLPGAGLLVYHVDDTKTNNTDETHYWVGLKEAHGGVQNMSTGSQRGDAGDPYPGTGKRTTFSDTTDPNAFYYDGLGSRIVLDRISASGADMTALIFPDSSTESTDVSAPTTTSDAKASYYGTATISITATDGIGYGVQSTTWTLDGKVGAGSVVTTSALGPHTLKFSSVDWAGNAEATTSVAFTVYPADTTAPTTTSDALTHYTDAATITLTPTDSGSGVARTDWILDGAEGSGTVVGSTALGNHTLYYWSTDLAGNVEASRTASFDIAASLLPDTLAPVTTISGLPAGWSKSAVSITLDAVDGAKSGEATAGILATYYSLNGGARQTYSGSPFTVSAQGVTEVSYRSLDASGNAETSHTASVQIDSAAPDSSDNHVSDYSGSASIKITATDSNSGAASTSWKLDGGSWTTGTPSPTVTTDVAGAHTLQYYSTDAAGNSGAVVSVGFNVTAVLPSGTIVPGDHVSVTLPGNETFEFDHVDATGTVTCVHAAPGQAAPAGRKFLSGGYYSIHTTAGFTGAVTIRHTYDPSSISGFDASQLKLYHYTGGAWVDATTGVDTVGHVVTGSTTSFSDFALTGPQSASPATVTSTPASSDWSLALAALIGVGLLGIAARKRTQTR